MGDDLCVAEVQEWADGLAQLRSLIGRRFTKSEPREHAIAYVRGLLSTEERKNSWTLSERAGDGTPAGCNGCCRPLTGTRTLSVMTCSVTSLTISVIPAGS